MGTTYPLFSDSSNIPSMPQSHPPTFETVLTTPHFNLSAHTFAVHSLPLHQISAILDLLASDQVTTRDLLILDQINQTIVNLEWQIDEHHRLAAQQFSVLLRHRLAQRIPQHIHNIEQPDCRRCWIQRRQPTPFPRSPQPIIVHASSSESESSSSSSSLQTRYQRMPSYLHCLTPVPVASTSSTAPPPFPLLTTCSSRVYPWNYFEANAADCLQHLRTVLEERRWGTAAFPIVVEEPDAEDDIFQQYYHWFINKGWD